MKIRLTSIEEFLYRAAGNSLCGSKEADIHSEGLDIKRPVKYLAAYWRDAASLTFPVRYHHPEMWHLKDVIYLPRSRTLIDPRNCIATRELTCWDRYSSAVDFYGQVCPSPRISIADGLIEWKRSDQYQVIEDDSYMWHGQDNFGHHIYETAIRTRMHRIAARRGLKFLDFSKSNSIEKWGLFDGVDEDLRLPLVEDYAYRLKSLYIPEPSIYRGADRIISLSARDFFAFYLKVDDSLDSSSNTLNHPICHPKAIFISRSDAKHRLLVNEEEVIDFLSPLSPVVMRGSEGDLMKQIRMIRSAAIIFAPLGAASSITAFSRAGAKVIEFSPHANVWGMFNSRLAAAMFGHDYIRINGVPTPETDRSTSPLNWNYALDIGILGKLMEGLCK
jgi:hypothetical protein